ncbi:MAG TPA: glycosyltransferase, partial [Acidimicrobiales bacterium]|nr:glycosyltransferase [Acidimicrobiales bacterium]
VGNGVELDRFTGAQPIDTDGPTILFIGRHEKRKGLDVLLGAFDRLDDALQARLWVAGEVPETKTLRHRYDGHGRIHWLGRIDDGELAARMAGADVLCAPSLHGESFGIVLVEGMAARCVVVASDLPGYREVLGRFGPLVPPGDVDALAAALTAVLSDVRADGGVASQRALDAAARHAEQWSIDVIAERYVAVYERAVAMDSGP